MIHLHESNTYLAYGLAALVFIFALWPLAKKVLYPENTAVRDIEVACQPRKTPKMKGTAICAGGSYTGLVTARVLSDHFEKVVLIESETFETPYGNRSRKNVPQYNQVHTILPYTFWGLKSLFPTINEAMLRANGRISKKLSNYTAKGDRIKIDPERLSSPWLCMSRPGFEPMIRELVLSECKNVEYVNGTVSSLLTSDDKKTVTGVKYRLKTGEGLASQEQTMAAVFVADCTGPACAGIKWLKAHNYPIPSKVQYSPAVHYTTITFPTSTELRENTQWPDNTKWGDGQVLIYANSADPSRGRQHGVYLQQTEEQRLMLALMAWGPNVIPDSKGSVEDIIDFAAQDPKLTNFAEIGRAHLEEARRLGETPQPHRLIVQNCWRYDYAAVNGLPSNYVCMGDSRERVNPTYGQGITKATVGAITLGATLNRMTQGGKIPSNFASTYFKTEADRTDYLYLSTKIEDYAFSSTTAQEGETLDFGAFARKYTYYLVKASHKDPKLGNIFWEITNCMRPPSDAMAPGVVFAVLKSILLG